MSRRVGTAPLIWHHLRSRSAGAVTVAALVLVLSMLAAAAPLALSVLGDTALRDRLTSLGPLDRDVEALTPGLPQFDIERLAPTPETSEVWYSFTRALERVRTAADDPLPGLLVDTSTVAFSRDNPVFDNEGTREVTLAYDPEYEAQIRITEGRLPAAPSFVVQEGAVAATPTEVVISTETAAEMGWAVGETLSLGTGASESTQTEVLLTGTFEPVDAQGDYWQHVPSVLTPNIFDDGNGPRRVNGTAFAHPAALPGASALPGAQSTLAWYAFDVEDIDAESAPDAVAALREFTSTSHTLGSSAAGTGILSIRFSADVTDPIELALAQQAATTAVLAMIIAGPIGVAIAVLILGCRLMLERRRASLRLLSARGAATGQLRALLGLEGFFAGVLPALLGAAIVAVAGATLVGAALPASALLPIALLGVAPIAILAVLAGSTAERQLRTDLGGRGSLLRLVVEGTVVVLTIVALTLLFVRGYAATGFDPLQAATPLLLSLVACLLTLRLYPLPLRRVLDRARRGPGIIEFLGAARAVREPTIGLTPVLALVVGVSVAVSSGILLSALQGGIAESARAQVGADLRITGATFTGEQLERVRAADGVAAAAGISGADPAALDVGGAKRSVWVFVVDAAELSDVQGSEKGLLPAGGVLEGSGARMPVIVSAETAELIGGEDELVLGDAPAEVVGVVDGPTPLGGRANWVVIDSGFAEEALGRDPTDRTILVRLEEGAALAPIEDELRAILGSSIRVDEVGRIAEAIEDGPAVQGVRIALVAATGVAALLSALALLMTLALAAPARARVLALLQTLGLPPRTANSLALWEIGPPAIAALVAGTLFGALMPLVVLAAVDMRPFTGSSVQPAYQVDIVTLAVAVGGFVGMAALFTGAALLIARRRGAASELRTVEEG